MSILHVWNIQFENVKKQLCKVARPNYNFKAPTSCPLVMDNIYKQIDELPVKDYFATYLPVPFSMKARVKSILPIWLKVLIKKHK